MSTCISSKMHCEILGQDTEEGRQHTLSLLPKAIYRLGSRNEKKKETNTFFWNGSKARTIPFTTNDDNDDDSLIGKQVHKCTFFLELNICYYSTNNECVDFGFLFHPSFCPSFCVTFPRVPAFGKSTIGIYPSFFLILWPITNEI